MMLPVPNTAPHSGQRHNNVASGERTVLIVDDSRTSRAYIESVINREPDLKVVGSVFSGEKALEFLHNTLPDVITLDVEMPGLGGLATLEAIQRINTTLSDQEKVMVLMVSAYTSSQAEVTQVALQGGASDFITKPGTQINEHTPEHFSQELIAKIRGCLRKQHRQAQPFTESRVNPQSVPVQNSPTSSVAPRTFRAILIGASTGGPKALADLLPELTQRVEAPILLVQHMPAGFTRSLAENLQRRTTWPVKEAQDQERLEPRNIYIAPSGQHLIVTNHAGHLVSLLTDAPPESGCRPSASVLFRSAAQTLGKQALAIILTGMGNDGASGLSELHAQGGYVIAQDESSSIVWGMPGSAVEKKAVDRVLPLDLIASHVALMTGPRVEP